MQRHPDGSTRTLNHAEKVYAVQLKDKSVFVRMRWEVDSSAHAKSGYYTSTSIPKWPAAPAAIFDRLRSSVLDLCKLPTTLGINRRVTPLTRVAGIFRKSGSSSFVVWFGATRMEKKMMTQKFLGALRLMILLLYSVLTGFYDPEKVRTHLPTYGAVVFASRVEPVIHTWWILATATSH